MFGKIVLLLAVATVLLVDARATNEDFGDKHMHSFTRSKRETTRKRPGEETAEFWTKQAQFTLNEKLNTKPNTNVAKNVIMFLGDGMSIPTLMAARVYLAQKNGQKDGEENVLSFEEFPYTALSKTYCVDKQVADSACSATAYLCGVKANEGTIGVTAQVPLGSCEPSTDTRTHVTSIGRWSQLKNKKTGIVTTTRITHASPSGIYAHTAHRDWESNNDVIDAHADPNDCPDIAQQLIHGETGRNLNVILGGGRRKFYLNSETDPEGEKGNRTDKNLITEWKTLKNNKRAEYVWNREDLMKVSPNTEYLLGLFESDHCQYDLERNTSTDPSLTEMTEVAIKLLRNSREGYFLFVEGGRIDHAHHDAHAKKALDETVEFANAIRRAIELTSRSDTLIVVTSDHAHTLSVSGYPDRGNNILGIADMADDSLPYSSITYANGPGFRMKENGSRFNLREDNMNDINYKFPSSAPLEQETHGGDDVGVFSIGPWSHLLTGSIEQNFIPHVMAYASCVGNGVTTYCVDKQVADSACSATAYLCGVKANEGTIGVTAQVPLGECKPSQDESTHVTSIARWSQLKNKKTGVVTTTRITHASPTGTYGNIAHRDWESDKDVIKDGVDPKDCPDIAHQLVFGDTGKNFNVMLGGGRQNFYMHDEEDEEGGSGKRQDRNLIDAWKETKEGTKHAYVWNREDLLNIPDDTEHVLGLFESGHCQYEMERDKETDPSLTEMTETAIRLLQGSEEGFFLFVEGGRIDHAHHDSLAKKALDETLEFANAIRRAVEMTARSDTLIVVTSDHAHTMSVSGYPDRGNDILGIADFASDDLPYSTITYANGLGYTKEEEGERHDLRKDDMGDKDYNFPSTAPLDSETHGGDDVGVFSIGPWAHLLTGSIEQNVIPHIMAYASCVGTGTTVCDS